MSTRDNAVLDARKKFVTRLGRFGDLSRGAPFQMRDYGGWRMNGVALEHIQRIFIRRGVGCAGPGCDMRGIITRHVRHDQSEHRRAARGSEMTTLYD